MNKTLRILPLKKLLINWNQFPLTPFCLNLNNNASCKTLSNALDVSRDTPRVSRVGLQSKLVMSDCKQLINTWITRVIKPDWWLDNRFLYSKNLKSSLKISFSKILLHIGRRDTGRKFDTICLSFFLWTWTIFALFHGVANVPAAIECRIIKVGGWATELVQSLIILSETLLWPCALFISKALIILITSDSPKVIDWMPSSVR